MAAAIHLMMFNQYKLTEIKTFINEMEKVTLLEPFSFQVIDFLNEFSKKLLKDEAIRKFPELTVLGFWLRKSNIQKIKYSFQNNNKNKIFTPRGLVFQIPPSNVNSILIYTWTLSLLAGNKNVTRISINQSSQLLIISRIIEELFGEKKWKDISARNKFISYEYDDDINKFLSFSSDLRVVWGGDKTVEKLRTFKLNTHGSEINFPDKISFSIIDVESYSNLDRQKKFLLAEKFMNDAYWFNQMACSSPRVLFWLNINENNKSSLSEFWQQLDYLLKENGKKLDFIDSINKKVVCDRIAIELEKYKIFDYSDRRITRVSLNNPLIKEDLMPGAGFFYECDISKLEDLLPFLNRKVQTISYFGIEYSKWMDFIIKNKPRGIDRVVPIGNALDFDVVWDGIDLIRSFSREISLK